MKKVITYGTFDLLHYGHINLLRRAKELGDYLIVALSTDEFNWNEKQKKCYFTYEERYAMSILLSPRSAGSKSALTSRNSELTPSLWAMTGRASSTFLRTYAR